MRTGSIARPCASSTTSHSARRVAPSDAGAAVARALGPESVSRVVLMRLAQLQPGATELARAAAVLDDGAPLPLVAEQARLEPALAAEAADALAGADILLPGEPV